MHKLRILLFVGLFTLLSGFVAARPEQVDRLSDFSHYRDGIYEVLQFKTVALGTIRRQFTGPGQPVKEIPMPRENVYSVGFRYSAEPDSLYFIQPSYWAHQPHIRKMLESLGGAVQSGTNERNRPIYTTKHMIGVSLHNYELLKNPGFSATQVRGKTQIGGWKLPPVSSPDQVQIVIYMNPDDAAKGKNLFTATVGFPKPGDENKSAGIAVYNDKAIPAGIVFALMFLALGLSGAAAGASSKSGNSDGSLQNAATTSDDNPPQSHDEEDWQEELEKHQPEPPPIQIHLNRNSVVIIEGSSSHPPLNARIAGGEGENWVFSVDPVNDLEKAVAACSCTATEKNSCSISVTAERFAEEAGRSISSEIRISARGEKSATVVTAKLTVIAARKGLILASPTPVRIAADGETETEICITAITAFDGKITTDFDLLQKLRFSDQIETSSEQSTKAFSTARPVFRANGEDIGWRNLRGFEKGEPAEYVFKVRTSILLPGQGESYFGTARLSDSSGQHSLAIPLMLDVDLMQNESRAWEIELERCRQIIKRLPLQHQQRLNEMIYGRAQFLGAKGLYELRHKIWKAGQALWEAEGLSGYENVERWAMFIERFLNFAQWSGRMATDFLIANKLKIGIFAAMAVGELYDLTVSCIQAYRDEKTFEQWFEECFWREIRDMFVDMGSAALDPDKFVQKFSNDKKVVAIAWSIQFAYHFIANLTVRRMPVIDAAKQAALTVSIAAGLKYLCKKITEKNEGRKSTENDNLKARAENIDDAAGTGWENAKKKISDFEDALKSGDKSAIKDKMLDIQSDKFALKEINKWSDELKLAYNKEMSKLYASIDQRVKKKIIQDLKAQGIEISSKDLKMTNATNSVNKVKVGSDRDISVEYTFTDKAGKTVTVEYPKDKLKDAYGREFYRSVGHKKAGNTMPDELMDKYDQYCLDSGDAEAYGSRRMNFEKGQAENLDFGRALNKNGLPEKFDDGAQIGMTASYKAKHWFNKATDAIKGGNAVEGESFKMEGMSQLVKQYKNLYKGRRDLLTAMGKRQADDSSLRKMIDMMEKAVNLEKSPAYVEKLVKDNGFVSLNAFADAFGDKLASMNSMM